MLGNSHLPAMLTRSVATLAVLAMVGAVATMRVVFVPCAPYRVLIAAGSGLLIKPHSACLHTELGVPGECGDISTAEFVHGHTFSGDSIGAWLWLSARTRRFFDGNQYQGSNSCSSLGLLVKLLGHSMMSTDGVRMPREAGCLECLRLICVLSSTHECNAVHSTCRARPGAR